jgi:chromosomal replication initiator protein
MGGQNLWKIVLEEMRISLSPANFNTWFKGSSLVNFKNLGQRAEVKVGFPNAFLKETVELRYKGQIKEILERTLKKNCQLVFEVKRVGVERREGAGPLFEGVEKKREKEREGIEETIRGAFLRPDFTFENFAVSSTNQMAHAAAVAVAKSPGKAYNPLFLYGGVGVGKTHLAQAIGIEVLKTNPRMRLIYCTGEEFTNEIIEAIQRKTTNEFKKKYRGAAVLLIDDIQFIAGKTTVQEEFFHTFNAVLRWGGQVVLTSDGPPQEISRLEERLRSRFEGGLIIDIQQPSFELRCAILLIKAKQRGMMLPMETVQVVAGNIESTRRLEGFLVRLLSETSARKIPVTEDLVRELLGKTRGEEGRERGPAPAKEVVAAVAGFYGIRPSFLRGGGRSKAVVLPRHVLMYLLRNESRLTLMEIGGLLGGRDHTTVMYGVERITKELSGSNKLREELTRIKKTIHNHG